MKGTWKCKSWVFLIAGVALLTPALAGAAAVTDHPVATVILTPTSVEWTPITSYDRLVLTVSGPDGVVRQPAIEQGTSPVLEVVDTQGKVLPDGAYTWELRVVPKVSPEMRQAMTAALEDGELRPAALPNQEPVTQTGYFRIEGGTIVSPEIPEAPAAGGAQKVTASSVSKVTAPDQVFFDDVIVRGSLCVGFDCNNFESFGFDTIRLKENNLRIKFEDTSSTLSFPTQDWQITANDSANGGANRFSIDAIAPATGTPFTIEAGAPSSSLYVDRAGRLGLGTSTPILRIHTVSGDTPGLRLDQDGSSGFTPQTWDVAGNEANFFIRDASHGSKLPFRIRPGAPTSSIDIAASGDVGIGTVSPQAAVDIVRDGSGAAVSFLRFTNKSGPGRLELRDDTGGVNWDLQTTSDDAVAISKDGTGVDELRLDAGGNLTITGSLTTAGTICNHVGCDRVFKRSSEVESIEDHAREMWAHSYLPAVGPTPEGAPFNLSEKTGGMLNELEKAHIYIAHLNDALKAKSGQIQELSQHVAELEKYQDARLQEKEEEISALQARLRKLEEVVTSLSER